jgi:hypothetical protein
LRMGTPRTGSPGPEGATSARRFDCEALLAFARAQPAPLRAAPPEEIYRAFVEHKLASAPAVTPSGAADRGLPQPAAAAADTAVPRAVRVAVWPCGRVAVWRQCVCGGSGLRLDTGGRSAYICGCGWR